MDEFKRIPAHLMPPRPFISSDARTMPEFRTDLIKYVDQMKTIKLSDLHRRFQSAASRLGTSTRYECERLYEEHKLIIYIRGRRNQTWIVSAPFYLQLVDEVLAPGSIHIDPWELFEERIKDGKYGKV